MIAESGAQRAALWRLREEHSEAQKRAGASVKNDVSVPVSKVPELIRRATEICERLVPGISCVPFGHLGDGNIHVNLVQPEGADPAAFLARDHELMDAVNAVVRDLDGSFSAEHGIGRLKPYMMPEWRGGAELDLMRRIKEALDPQGLLNPGKLLPVIFRSPGESRDRIPQPLERRSVDSNLRNDPQVWRLFASSRSNLKSGGNRPRKLRNPSMLLLRFSLRSSRLSSCFSSVLLVSFCLGYTKS